MVSTDKEAIGLFISHHQDHGRGQSSSTHIALLRDARKFTNRDLNTGEILSNNPALVGSWLGNLGYLVLLDQLGSAITLKNNRDTSNRPSIIKCLTQFSSLSDQEINALYALRNSFAHDYSLVNISQTPRYRFRFRLTANENDPTVRLSEKMWDGNVYSGDSDTVTTINLWAFGNLVEQIVVNIRTEYLEGNIEINLKNGIPELLARHIFFISK